MLARRIQGKLSVSDVLSMDLMISKCLLNPLPNLSEEDIEELQTMLERMFVRNLHLDGPKKIYKKEAAKAKPKSRSRTDASKPRGAVDDGEMEAEPEHEETMHPTPSTLRIDPTLLAFLSTLSTSFATNIKSKKASVPSIDDDDLEDIIYFLLDTYHSLGVPFDVAEVDVGLLVVGFKGVLEEWGAKMRARERDQARSRANRSQGQGDTSPADPHLFLILDRHLQGLPWENLPIMNGRSVSRIPSVDFLVDRVVGAKTKWESSSAKEATPGPKIDTFETVSRYDPSTGHPLDPTRGFFILNPSGDLVRTEERFRGWTEGMRKNGWGGVVGRAVGESEFLGALGGKDILVCVIISLSHFTIDEAHVDTLVMGVASSISEHIRSVRYLDVLLQCFGAVHLVPCAKLASSTVVGRLGAIWSVEGTNTSVPSLFRLCSLAS